MKKKLNKIKSFYFSIIILGLIFIAGAYLAYLKSQDKSRKVVTIPKTILREVDEKLTKKDWVWLSMTLENSQVIKPRSGEFILKFNSDFTTITGGYIVFGNHQNINVFYPKLTTFTLSAGSSISTPIFKTLSVPFDWMTNSYVNPNLPLSLPVKADNVSVCKPVPSVSTYPFLKWLVEEGADFYNPYQIGELVRSMGVDYVQLWDFSINITLDTARSYQYLKTCFDAYNVKLLGINTHFDDHYIVDATSDDNLSNPGVKGIAFKNAWDRQQALNVIKLS